MLYPEIIIVLSHSGMHSAFQNCAISFGSFSVRKRSMYDRL